MQQINLKEARQGFKNKSFGTLIKSHMEWQKQETRIRAMMQIIDMLPEKARPMVKDFIDRWNGRIYDRDLWQSNCDTVFDEIVEDAENMFSQHDISFDDATLFNMFSLVALNYTYTAYNQPKVQEVMGIQHFPWVSALFLLYPIAATFYVLKKHIEMSAFAAATWGLVNLGYVIFFAALFRGTFGILGLHKRAHTFAFGIGAIVIGIALTNMGV